MIVCPPSAEVRTDLPFGADDLRWVTNTATVILGERDAILIR